MIARLVKRALRHIGIDARRFRPQSSEDAMMARLLTTWNVDCVFDVGANTGQYAQGLRDLGFSGRIVSFEPLSEAHSLLVGNSRHDSNWTVAPAMALGDVDGEADMHVSENSVSSSIRRIATIHELAAPSSRYVGEEKVRLHRLDSVFAAYVATSARPFLKVDTQGYEMEVLNGAALCLDRFVGVQAEMSLSELYEGQTLVLDLAARMQDEGLYLVALFPGLADNRTGRLLQVDGVWFREDSTDQK